jgi:hypothetical protein
MVVAKQELVQPVTHRTLSGVHRTMSGDQAGALCELAALGFSQRLSTKIHRTVWCGTRLSGETTEQQSTSPKGVTPLVLLSLKLEHNIISISISCVCYT